MDNFLGCYFELIIFSYSSMRLILISNFPALYNPGTDIYKLRIFNRVGEVFLRLISFN